MEKRKCSVSLCQHDVCRIERIDRSDVRPVPSEYVRFDAIAVERTRDYLAAKVGRRVRMQHLKEHVARRERMARPDPNIRSQ
jgi:hypothetical protein